METLEARSTRYLESLESAADFLRERLFPEPPEIAVVLGSGLGDAVSGLEDVREVPYAKIPHFPVSAVPGHSGVLRSGRLGQKRVAVFQGRWHLYEGHPVEKLILPIRVLGKLGTRTLVLTSAVGSLRAEIKPGHLVLLNDHINLSGTNALRGLFDPSFGPMFPDMSEPYEPQIRNRALELCRRRKIPCQEGVYLMVSGPSYETPAEIRAFRQMGADVVGMSTVPEVLAARQLGVKVLAFSWISNFAAGLSAQTLRHEEVLELGRDVSRGMASVFEELLPSL